MARWTLEFNSDAEFQKYCVQVRAGAAAADHQAARHHPGQRAPGQARHCLPEVQQQEIPEDCQVRNLLTRNLN